MIDNKQKVFAQSKVDINHQKIEAYLAGERIYPTTIELDLTQLCTRACPGCPYSASRRPGLTLQLPFLDRLFSVLGPNTPGIVFSGGEPTVVPHFPETLALARRKGFSEVAIISNGGNIHKPEVQAALLKYATSIRISLYDWQEEDSEYFLNTLRKIDTLRGLIDREGSKLEIGASILTRSDLNDKYESVARRAIDSGIHWLYFHPYCVDWDKTHPVQADQTGVLAAIDRLKEVAPETASIQVPVERYSEKPLFFNELHGAHFLIQVGADGVNYAGPECKYDPEAALLDLNEHLTEDFLWHPDRLESLRGMNSDNYRFIGTKHRPPMFSDYIERIIQLKGTGREEEIREPASSFRYPNII